MNLAHLPLQPRLFAPRLRKALQLTRSGLAGDPSMVTYVIDPAEKSGVIFDAAASRPSRRLVQVTAAVLLVGSLTAAAVLYGPWLYYQLQPQVRYSQLIAAGSSPFGGAFSQGVAANQELAEATAGETRQYVPPKQPGLPEGNWIVVPRIGVRTQLRSTDNPEEALEKGVWWVPGFGGPGDTTQPMIVAAHRYGFVNWWEKTDYWKYHSFYLLPELEPGDQIEVISDQRKWVYEVYGGEEAKEITDYTADLILYTCKYLQSPVRHVRYARLIDPTIDTQQAQVYNDPVLK